MQPFCRNVYRLFIALKMMVATIRTLSIISGAHQFHSLKEGGVMLSV